MENKKAEKAFIIIPLSGNEDEQIKADEIKELTTSAGAEIYGVICYYVREISAATFITSGKLSEIKSMIDFDEVNLVIFDGELSPSQTLNISSELDDVKVIDRTTLILDIFASNAVTSEGKMQIELAQLKYIYPRLKGKGQGLSRLGGGIGTRGPGESRLETDRRHIRLRIKNLEKKLKELETRRGVQTARREKNECKTVALVGYTNTGKSTLLNALTGAETYTKDKLFATLDPTLRKLKLKNFEVVVVDTVGFIRNIPHHIIEAFKSTLEFAANADLILNVADGSGDWKQQLETTEKTLEESKNLPPVITVINKCDKVDDFSFFPSGAVFISAKEGAGLDKLKDRIDQAFSNDFAVLSIEISYSNMPEFTLLAKTAERVEYNYKDDFVSVSLSVRKIYLSRFEKYIKN